MLTVRQDRPALWRFSLATVAIALGGMLFAQSAALPAAAAPTAHTKDFQGINWADPRDNFADDAVVPTGLSTSDSYATTYAKATSILRGFRKETGANTVRLPINPYSVGNAWWASYTGAIDAATALGFKVILSYWEGTGSAKDGKVDDLDTFWPMWTTVTTKYASNGRVYFDPMNEPHGYSLTEWSDLAAKWLSTYPTVRRDRVFVAGSGYDDDVTGVCADRRLNGTYLALHDYAYWGTKTYAGWVDDIKGRIGTCAGRTVLQEFGVPMTTGLNYNGSSTEGTADSNNSVAFLQAMTDTLRAQNMGSVYWPGLRQDDSYSLTQLQGSGTRLSLSVNNYSGLDRLRWGWGHGRPLHAVAGQVG